jgi:hypothetical protein
MNKQKDYLGYSEALSLLTLRIVLTDARRDVPPQVSRNDMSEELAAELIEKMKLQYKKYLRSVSVLANQMRIDW